MKPERIQIFLKRLEGWELELSEAQARTRRVLAPEGDAISKVYELEDGLAAARWVQTIAVVAQGLDHYPVIEMQGNVVYVRSATAGRGITRRDFRLARALDNLTPAFCKSQA